MAVLTAQEVERSRKIFTTFDKDGTIPQQCALTKVTLLHSRLITYAYAESGTIDVQELRAALQLLGQQPTMEELFIIISQVSAALLSLPLYVWKYDALC